MDDCRQRHGGGTLSGCGAGGAAGLPESAGSEEMGYVSMLAGLRWVRQNGSQYGIRIINISVGLTPKGMSEDLALVRVSMRRCRVCGRGGSGK